MILIVGLGNPGDEYKNTRHNVGFIAVDRLSDRYNFNWQHKSKFNADIAVGECELGKIILCKPDTFMNLSGQAVQPIMSFYKIPLENMIVIHDDIDLPLAKIKYKLSGGAGGHNGLKSLDKIVGSNYHRIRIGIDRPADRRHDVADYVLGKFSNKENEEIAHKIEILADKLPLLASDQIEKFKTQIG